MNKNNSEKINAQYALDYLKLSEISSKILDSEDKVDYFIPFNFKTDLIYGFTTDSFTIRDSENDTVILDYSTNKPERSEEYDEQIINNLLNFFNVKVKTYDFDGIYTVSIEKNNTLVHMLKK